MILARKAAILIGDRETGKTTLCLKLAGEISGAGGIVCPAFFDSDGNKIGFRCVSIATGESWELGSVRREFGGAGHSTGKYLFSETGIEKGITSIRESLERDGGITIIDEIGPLELREGRGFAPVLQLLAAAGNLIIVVRPGLIDEVVRFLPGHRYRLFHLTVSNRETLKMDIVSFFSDPRDLEGPR